MPWSQLSPMHATPALKVRELKHDDLIVKQKSLLAARELLGSGTSYVQCIAAGIVPPLINLLQVGAKTKGRKCNATACRP